MFFEISQRGSSATRQRLLRCGVSGALFRSLSSFKQTDKLLSETYGLEYGVIYNVDLVTNVFHCLRVLLLTDSNVENIAKYFGQEEIERLQNFNDTMLKAIAANQLDKWRVTQKKSEKNVETLAIELYSSIVQAHNVFATRNVGSTKRARISQQIHTRGRMYLQKWPNMMMQANALKEQNRIKAKKVSLTSNAGLSIKTGPQGQQMLVVKIEWGTYKSLTLQMNSRSKHTINHRYCTKLRDHGTCPSHASTSSDACTTNYWRKRVFKSVSTELVVSDHRFVRGVRAFVFEFSSQSSVLLYLGYVIDRHDTHLYHKRITRTATLKCTLEHSRITTLEHHARTQVRKRRNWTILSENRSYLHIDVLL